MPKIKLLLEYPEANIYSFISDRGEDIVYSFIDNNLQTTEQKKIINLIELFHQSGNIENKEAFKYLQDGVFEFKRGQVRILCYFLSGRKVKSLVLLHGFKKKCQRTPGKELDKAISRKNLLEKLQIYFELEII
jgi:phage-related protein